MRGTHKPKRSMSIAVCAAAVLAAAMLLLAVGASVASANGVPLAKGDVLAGVGSAQVKNFSPSGVLQDTLTDKSGASFTTGMCFDSEKEQHLYVTDFGATMSTYNFEGNLVTSPFGEGFPSGHPESCTLDAENHIFVGGPLSASIEELSTSGKLLETFTAESAGRTGGTDWVDLAANGCTIHYTGEGSVVKRYNVCTKTQEADFATGLPGPCFALRIRPNGEILVACQSEVLRLDSEGKVLQTYKLAGSEFLFALNLDPDGETFWTGDLNNGKIWRVNVGSGAVVTEFSSAPNTQLAGLAVVGEIEVAKPTITLTPTSATNKVGTTHTVTATVTEEGKPAEGVTVNFTVSGVNPQKGTAKTNSKGEASFTYEGKNAGVDHIVASFTPKKGGEVASNEVTKEWEAGRTGTCGKTTVGKTKDGYIANSKRVNACVLPVNATVSELSVYLSPTTHTGQQLIKGIIYADSKGTPAGLLGTTTQLTFTSKSPTGWYHLSFPVPVKLTAGNYWIGVITGATQYIGAEYFDSVAKAEDYNANSYAAGPSNPFGSFKTTNEQMSLYATYTAGTQGCAGTTSSVC